MGKGLDNVKTTFFFCDGGSCQKAKGEGVVRAARAHLRNNNLWDTTHTIKTRCNGRCEDAPTCIVYPGGYWYKNLDSDKIKKIVKNHTEDRGPVEESLLYVEGLEGVRSENERETLSIKSFREVNDANFGKCLITKGFHSDQYLHPLFEFLSEFNNGVTLELTDGKKYFFSDLIQVDYQESFTLRLEFLNGDKVPFVIGIVPKKELLDTQQDRISVVEYFIQIESRNKGIRFKNKRGEVVGVIKLPLDDEKVWNYCLKTQLNSIFVPEFDY